jgi:hypothetical protein
MPDGRPSRAPARALIEARIQIVGTAFLPRQLTDEQMRDGMKQRKAQPWKIYIGIEFTSASSENCRKIPSP